MYISWSALARQRPDWSQSNPGSVSLDYIQPWPTTLTWCGLDRQQLWVARVVPGPYQSMPGSRPDPWQNSSPNPVSGDHKTRSDLGIDHHTQVHRRPTPASRFQAMPMPSGAGWDHTSIWGPRFRAEGAHNLERTAALSFPHCVSMGPLCFHILIY